MILGIYLGGVLATLMRGWGVEDDSVGRAVGTAVTWPVSLALCVLEKLCERAGPAQSLASSCKNYQLYLITITGRSTPSEEDSNATAIDR